jgi:hypothetical protein
MSRILKEGRVRRHHYETHDVLLTYLGDLEVAYSFTRRKGALNCPMSNAYR